MENSAFSIAGVTVPWGIIVIVLATAQWVAFATFAARNRVKPPKHGLRPTERNLLLSTAAFTLLWAAAFLVSSTGPKSAVAAASVTGSGRVQGSCSSLENGMNAADVRKKMGQPDEVRKDEETRGPGAEVWIYKTSRCAVHLFEQKIEFID